MKVSTLIPMNLQLFSDSMPNESSVNAEPVVNVEPQQTNEPVDTTANEPVNAGSGEVAPSQTASKPVQSAEENAKFAAIRREAEAKAQAEAQKIVDAEYSRLYGAEYGIHSKADYDAYVAKLEREQQMQKEAAEYKADPSFLAYVKGLEEKIDQITNESKAKEEEAQREAFQKDIEKQLNEVLEIAKKDGFDITGTQLLDAAMENNLTDLKKVYKLIKPEVDTETLKQNAVKEYIEKLKQGQVPIEASGASPVVVNEPPKSFEDARKGAAAMLKASKIFN